MYTRGLKAWYHPNHADRKTRVLMLGAARREATLVIEKFQADVKIFAYHRYFNTRNVLDFSMKPNSLITNEKTKQLQINCQRTMAEMQRLFGPGIKERTKPQDVIVTKLALQAIANRYKFQMLGINTH